jgi:hypothetical protein
VKLIVYGFVLLAVIVLLPRGLAAGLTDAFRFVATRLRRGDEKLGSGRLEL